MSDLLDPFDGALAAGGLRTLFQPIVDLGTRETVGYEALTRGPVGSPLERPDLLFAAAHERRRVIELDVRCQAAAIHAAVAGGLAHPLRLFLNVEPETLGRTESALLDAYHEAARATLPLVVEVTERSITTHPAELLRSVERVRATGARVAMDDVGADTRALALLPLLRPDVIKLDLRLVQRQPSRAIARIVTAVNAEAERTGAVVLAEGIETEQHLATALALGATLGQGWLFGRPELLPHELAVPVTSSLRVRASDRRPDAPTPFAACADGLPVRIAQKGLLIEMSKHLEAEALASGEVGMLLSTFQHARHLTPDTRLRYRELADRLAFVAALGEDLPVEPLPGVRGALLHPDDPARGEWDVVVVGPHFAAALTARDLGDDGPDRDRRFEFVTTYDRDRVLAAARSLMARVWADTRATEVVEFGADDASLPTAATGAAAVASPEVTVPAGTRALPEVPSNLHLRALAATSNGVTIADARHPDLPLIYVNEGFERLTGYRSAEMLGRNCRFLQGPGTDPAAVRGFGEALRADRDAKGGRVRLLNYRADGTPWWNEVTVSPVHDAAGTLTHFIGIQADVTAEVESERRLGHLAFNDELTGLPNRRSLADSLSETLAEPDARGTALLFIDLDGFKAINDARGHDQGDVVLRWVAGQLLRTVREDDLVARQHGDEFVVVLRHLAGNAAGAAGRVADQVLEALRRPIPLPGGPVALDASIGIALAPVDGTGADQLLTAADRAMYEAKQAGKGRVAFASALSGAAHIEVE